MSSNNIYFAQKQPVKRKNFWDFGVLGSHFVKFLMPILKREVASSPIFLSFSSFIKDCSSVIFLAQTIYTLPKRSPLKWTFWELESSAQILSNSLYQFWNDNSLPLKIMYLFNASWKIIPLQFFNSNNIYFARKEPIKMKIFEILECSGQILSNSFMPILKGQVASSPIFFIFLQFHKRLFLRTFFSSNNIYFA